MCKASLTKTPLQLVDQRKLSLDTPINDSSTLGLCVKSDSGAVWKSAEVLIEFL